MRRALVAGLVLVIVALAGRSAWRTPTAALLRLKLALDRHDLGAVMEAVDAEALADQALTALLDEPAGDAERIRLVVRGDGAWLPAISSAREYLRLRIERDVARLVEDPGRLRPVSWTDLRRSIATVRRSGAVAHVVFAGGEGTEYALRLRWSRGRWRIVAVERDGAALLRAGAPISTSPVCDCSAPAPPPAAETEPPDQEARRRSRSPRRPFARRLSNGSWAVQVSSTTDAIEAELEREWLAGRGEEAFVMPAEIRGTTWQRVLVGGYATRAEAEASLARLRRLDTAVP
jgi:cell division septation protein DedD